MYTPNRFFRCKRIPNQVYTSVLTQLRDRLLFRISLLIRFDRVYSARFKPFTHPFVVRTHWCTRTSWIDWLGPFCRRPGRPKGRPCNWPLRLGGRPSPEKGFACRPFGADITNCCGNVAFGTSRPCWQSLKKKCQTKKYLIWRLDSNATLLQTLQLLQHLTV